MPILFGLTLIIIVFLYFSKSREKNAKKSSQEFWKRERDSQFVPRKDISSLDYIEVPYADLPFRYWAPGTDAPVRRARNSSAVSTEFVSTGEGVSMTPAPPPAASAKEDFVASADFETETISGSLNENTPYIRSAEYSAPLAEELAEVEHELCRLAGSRILNLTGISNTELRLTYGTANLDPLTAYDQNFTTLIRGLQKWGTLLASTEQKEDAVTVLSYAVAIGSDIAATYALLARLYKERGELHKIEEMKVSAEALTTLMKPSILRDLEQITSSES